MRRDTVFSLHPEPMFLHFSVVLIVCCSSYLCVPFALLQEELSEFSSFNYWRAPIADVDSLLADLNLLL